MGKIGKSHTSLSGRSGRQPQEFFRLSHCGVEKVLPSHGVEHKIAPREKFFGTREGIDRRRCLRNSSQGGALTNSQLRHVFAKIRLRGGMDAISVMAEENFIQIKF